VNLSWKTGGVGIDWNLFGFHCSCVIALGLAYTTNTSTNVKQITITLALPVFIGLISWLIPHYVQSIIWDSDGKEIAAIN